MYPGGTFRLPSSSPHPGSHNPTASVSSDLAPSSVRPDPGHPSHRGWPVAASGLAWLLLLVAASRISIPVPGTPVPQSLQTLAVVLVGAFLGPGPGGLVLSLYLVLGAAGLPVFADGAGGWRHLMGPTGGYLLAFVLAGILVGAWVDRADARGFLPTAVVLTAAHLLILALGWTRLAATLGPAAAFTQGVAPFIVGGAAKSLAGAGLVILFGTRTPHFHGHLPPWDGSSSR